MAEKPVSDNRTSQERAQATGRRAFVLSILSYFVEKGQYFSAANGLSVKKNFPTLTQYRRAPVRGGTDDPALTG
jgi:hypothetical protein